jgi:L-lactate dehydrogenase complex protein LldG
VSDRAKIFGDIRRALGVTGSEEARRRAVEDRLAAAPDGVIPARGHEAADPAALFRAEAERVFATVEQVASAADVPARIADFLRAKNLPPRLRRGADSYLAALPWPTTTLTLDEGPAQAADAVGLAHAFAAIAETGTLALVSGPDNPVTLNFLPETHIVIIEAEKIVGDYEAFWERLRDAYGKGQMPRTVNFITGPSRSADIEQTLLLGAHGPRALHIIIVGAAESAAAG